VLQKTALAKGNSGTYFVHVFARRGRIKVFSRRATGFDSWAKPFELNFFVRKAFL